MPDNKPQKMTEEQLNAFLDNELRQTIGYSSSGDEITAERERNLKMYLNRPLGDEVDGRSKLQDSSVQDVVEALLPDLLPPFISSDKAVEFIPTGKEDEKQAEQQSAYINHVFTVDNNGFMIQYTWMKDGILQKNGFVYADWVMKEKTRRSVVKVYYPDLQKMTDDKEIEILAVAAFDEQGNAIDPTIVEAAGFEPEAIVASAPFNFSPDEICYEVDFRRRWKEGRVKVSNIPPEFFIVSNTAVTEEDAGIIGWQEQVTLSQLREEGYPEDKLNNLAIRNDSDGDLSGERTAREQAQGGILNSSSETNLSTDKATRKFWRTVVWTTVDYDGDGKAELRKIVRVGERDKGKVILLNEEADEVPVISFTPIPMPHQLFGRCPADQAVPIQEGKTAIRRALMDGTYMTIEPRYGFVEELASEDTWDDLMLAVPGAPVRMEREGAVFQISDAPDLAAAYQILEYFDREKEARTPVTRQDMGIDPDVLSDKTAREATIQANASARKKELIIRLYAEALGRLFQLINRIVIKHQDRPRTLRLLNNYVEIDPRYWNADMDVSVNVGLGTGTKEQQLQFLQVIRQHQMELMQMGQVTGVQLVTPANIYNTEARLVEYGGLSSPELYFTDPENAEQQPQQPPQPSPEEMEAQKQAEAEQVQQAIDDAYEQGKQEGLNQLKMQEMASKERMHAKDVQINAAQINQKSEEMAIKAQLEAAKIRQSAQQADAARQASNAGGGEV